MKTPTKTPKNIQSPQKAKNEVNRIRGMDVTADTSKSDDEIIESILAKESEDAEIPINEVRLYLEKAIALTREACEKEHLDDIDNNNIYEIGFKEGQKAERERIFEIATKLRKNIHTTDFGRELLDWFEEELKKAVSGDSAKKVLKDSEGKMK